MAAPPIEKDYWDVLMMLTPIATGDFVGIEPRRVDLKDKHLQALKQAGPKETKEFLAGVGNHVEET